jgi:hypothetical protein
MVCAKLPYREVIRDRIERRKEHMPMAATKRPLGDPFLLPLCDCGGPMNLASLEPHPTRADHELKTFKCTLCGAQDVFNVQRRADDQKI